MGSPQDADWIVIGSGFGGSVAALRLADNGTVCVAEVKSLSGTNDEKQLRLALGQVLRYAHLLRAKGRPVRCYIAVESKPADESWFDLCSELGIRLLWPEIFASAVRVAGLG